MYKIDGVLIWKLQFCGLSNQVLPGSHLLTAVGLVRDVIQTRLKIQLEILIRFSLDIRMWFIWYLGQIASGPKVLKNSVVIKWRINLGSLFSTPGLAQWFWCWGGENWEILWGLWERRGIGVVAGETLSITTGLSMPLSCCCLSILMVIRDVVGWSFWGTPKTFPKIMCNGVRCVLYASLEVIGHLSHSYKPYRTVFHKGSHDRDFSYKGFFAVGFPPSLGPWLCNLWWQPVSVPLL